ncbi:fungal specific transcription factor, putative [Talaromyces stipitatus ATCC 10500]|uniref:Fungal specific transcription factor, putative n=1 Tax=Talaromyces stipitatus (strain ATCC 10500 / CBS 375.48 / QM 6759 / NRRL 1006) TaxID=441959 RepID=B8MGJ5_TALSN|nr:fungal specific transcription factor, putative [Talaromyces stipitatus ATCC 10500]EED16746.1 fungal specific transcription factor, putative [Talaromyces stipitatus ATCC 10500]
MQAADPPFGTSELGFLRVHSNDESEFVGSSSGVFFVNTVRQAFTKSLRPLETGAAPGFPTPEDTLVGSPKPSSVGNDDGRDPSRLLELRAKWTYDPQIARYLGEAPGLEVASQLMMIYFERWHPIFPVLHGPSFLMTMEAFYSETRTSGEGEVSKHHRACWTAIFQGVFNIASILRPDLQLAHKSKIISAADAVQLANVLLNRHDILSFQAILAIQLYLIASMSLRSASLLGGTILRAILHAGYHRCPYRYEEFDVYDRFLRKRIFWSFYAIDRYLSQALGLPLGIQDSDIDVCLPAVVDCHKPGNPLPLPSMSPGRAAEGPSEIAGSSTLQHSLVDQWSIENSYNGISPRREITLAAFVFYGRLTGRALELFHKSIHARKVPRDAVSWLVSDVFRWWNGLASNLEHVAGRNSTVSTEDFSPKIGPLFFVLYKHLILCINRPYLSREPSSSGFSSGLQMCLEAAKSILSSLKTQLSKEQDFFWPGLLSAAYMAGLVIAFACQLGQYSIFNGCQEISDCLDILQAMSRQWEIAKHCHTALSILLKNIQRQGRDRESSSSKRLHQPNSQSTQPKRRSKRRKKTSADHEDDHTASQSYDNANYQAQETRNATTAVAQQSTEISSNNISNTLHVSSESAQLYQPPTDSNNISSFEDVTLAVPMINDYFNIEGIQSPDESSFFTTNFDLNMTDLFQNSTWDPKLFDAFNQG